MDAFLIGVIVGMVVVLLITHPSKKVNENYFHLDDN